MPHVGAADTRSQADHSGPESPAQATLSEVTAVELAAALQGEDDGLAEDVHDGEGMEDEFDWEDAGVPAGDGGAERHCEREGAGGTQPQRRDVWSRTHGYKFGRKLGDWAGGEAAAGEGGTAAVEASPAVDPLEAAVLEATADAAANGPAAEESIREHRSLQHGILNSLGVVEAGAAAAEDGRATTGTRARPTSSGGAEAQRAPEGTGCSALPGLGGAAEGTGGAVEMAAPARELQQAQQEATPLAEVDAALSQAAGSAGPGDGGQWGRVDADGSGPGHRGMHASDRMHGRTEDRDGGTGGAHKCYTGGAQAAVAAVGTVATGGVRMRMPKWRGQRAAGGAAGTGASQQQIAQRGTAAAAGAPVGEPTPASSVRLTVRACSCWRTGWSEAALTR